MYKLFFLFSPNPGLVILRGDNEGHALRWRGVRFAVEMAAELELLLKLVLLGAALDLLVNLQQVLHAVRPVNHAFECTDMQ